MAGLMSMDIASLERLMEEFHEPRFRAKQIFSWLARGQRPEGMTNLPNALRAKLAQLPFGGAKRYEKFVSAKDGTVKYLFELEDGNLVEGVLMRYHYGNTLCISTQVGCKMGCAFCASTLNGCVRNLEPGEMLAFIACAEEDDPPQAGYERSVTNVVLMGSGEPLDNYDNTLAFLRLASAPEGMNISPRNISLSTCGLADKMERLADEAPHVTLSVSLHAPNDDIRNDLMPVNRVYGIDKVLAAAKNYADKTGRRVIFEYALVDGKNADERCAAQLAGKLRGINCHVNLIPLNPVEERRLSGVSRDQARRFAAWLEERGVSATVRREMGTDIQGACGQLRRRVLENKPEDDA